MQTAATVAAGRTSPADEIREALAAPSAPFGLTLPALMSMLHGWSGPFVVATVARMEDAGELVTDATQTPTLVRLVGRRY